MRMHVRALQAVAIQRASMCITHLLGQRLAMPREPPAPEASTCACAGTAGLQASVHVAMPRLQVAAIPCQLETSNLLINLSGCPQLQSGVGASFTLPHSTSEWSGKQLPLGSVLVLHMCVPMPTASTHAWCGVPAL